MIKSAISDQRSAIRKQNTHTSADQRGSALIITLLLITILTGLVVDFVYEVYIDSSSLSNWGNAQKASLIAKSGQAIASEFIRDIKVEKYTDKREVELPVEQDFGPNISLQIKLEDEESKFNINSLIGDDGRTEDIDAINSLKKMLEYLNINPNLALSIADWIDTDSEPRLYNSENLAKNDYFWSVDELKLVEGVNREIFDKISPYLTIHKNTNLFKPQININTAEIPVLMSLKDMTETLAKNIIDHRKNYPFEKPEDVLNVLGMDQMWGKLSGKISIKCTGFKVTSKATVNEITRIIESVIDSNSKIQFWREG